MFLTNDGDLANRILQAHHLPQTYQLKLKTLLTFAEIETSTRLTGARISRLRGKDAPWYEVTLSEARRDALRNKLFQTGHPVEKMKRTRIANLELDKLVGRTLPPAIAGGARRSQAQAGRDRRVSKTGGAQASRAQTARFPRKTSN